jgi:hypothetical protein
MRITYSLLSTSRCSMQFNVHDDQPTQLYRFDGQMLPVEDVVSLLICSGMSTEEIGFWLECRMDITNLVPLTEAIQ